MSSVERSVRERVDMLLRAGSASLLDATARDVETALTTCHTSKEELLKIIKEETSDPRKLKIRTLQDAANNYAQVLSAQVESMAATRKAAEEDFITQLGKDLATKLAEVVIGYREELRERAKQDKAELERKLDTARRTAIIEKMRMATEGSDEFRAKEAALQQQVADLQQQVEDMKTRVDMAESAVKKGLADGKRLSSTAEKDNAVLRRQLHVLEDAMRRTNHQRVTIETQLLERQAEFWRRKPMALQRAVPKKSEQVLLKEARALRRAVNAAPPFTEEAQAAEKAAFLEAKQRQQEADAAAIAKQKREEKAARLAEQQARAEAQAAAKAIADAEADKARAATEAAERQVRPDILSCCPQPAGAHGSKFQ